MERKVQFVTPGQEVLVVFSIDGDDTTAQNNNSAQHKELMNECYC